jgi:hypothetical protein
LGLDVAGFLWLYGVRDVAPCALEAECGERPSVGYRVRGYVCIKIRKRLHIIKINRRQIEEDSRLASRARDVGNAGYPASSFSTTDPLFMSDLSN